MIPAAYVAGKRETHFALSRLEIPYRQGSEAKREEIPFLTPFQHLFITFTRHTGIRFQSNGRPK